MPSSHLGLALLVSVLVVNPQQAIGSTFSPGLSWNCSGCHGFEGVSEGPLVPSIAAMNARLFFYIMRGYKLDERPSTIMGRIAKGYSLKELRAMADYFEGWPWRGALEASLEIDRERALELHDDLCAECHDDEGRFQDKEIPRLAGQWPAYLSMMLTDYRDAGSGTAEGSAAGSVLPQPEKMRERVQDLSDEEINLLSLFYSQIN